MFDLANEFAFWRNTATPSLRSGEFWALQDISFSLQKGESLGIIGHNGAGKTTLLKLIAGIIKPDHGSITVRGRLGALFVHGPGFHPLLTGRQNVFVAGSILGYTGREISSKEARILEFADIGDAIDAPSFTYSSGMIARLGFAIASHLEPDLLLIDEVLAVGDAAFQSRCLERIHELRDRGTAFIVVSHNPYQIDRLCDRALVLKQGKLVREIRASEAVGEHYRLTIDRPHPLRPMKEEDSSDKQTRRASIMRVEVLTIDGLRINEIQPGNTFRVRIHYYFAKPVKTPLFTVKFENEAGIMITQTSSRGALETGYFGGQGSIDLIVADFNAMPGHYSIGAMLNSGIGRLDEKRHASELTVSTGDSDLLARTANRGIFVLNGRWELSP
ncbi:MAG: ABC transporter ATP-binding protein [Luteolibacter sp.]